MVIGVSIMRGTNYHHSSGSGGGRGGDNSQLVGTAASAGPPDRRGIVRHPRGEDAAELVQHRDIPRESVGVPRSSHRPPVGRQDTPREPHREYR